MACFTKLAYYVVYLPLSSQNIEGKVATALNRHLNKARLEFSTVEPTQVAISVFAPPEEDLNIRVRGEDEFNLQALVQIAIDQLKEMGIDPAWVNRKDASYDSYQLYTISGKNLAGLECRIAASRKQLLEDNPFITMIKEVAIDSSPLLGTEAEILATIEILGKKEEPELLPPPKPTISNQLPLLEETR